MNIQQLFEQLDALGKSISLEKLKDLLQQLQFSPSDASELVQFDQDKYQRNLLHRTPDLEALLLCFEAGQRTPIHDHAGSACGVKVIQGTGVETSFESTAEGWLYASSSQELPEGGVVGSNDSDIHQLSNLQGEGKRLITLHIYSPPLGEVGNYSITDNSVTLVTAQTREPEAV